MRVSEYLNTYDEGILCYSNFDILERFYSLLMDRFKFPRQSWRYEPIIRFDTDNCKVSKNLTIQ